MSGGLSEYSTGWVMLFSAGTFLYVSTVHVLPEISHEVSFIDRYKLKFVIVIKIISAI